MARRRWVTVEIRVVQHVDDRTFTTRREFELPFESDKLHSAEKDQILRAFAEAFATSEIAADKVWATMGARRIHTREECNNPDCRIHRR